MKNNIMYFNLLNICFLNTCYVPGTILGSGDIAVNKADKSPYPHEMYIQVGVGGQIIRK